MFFIIFSFSASSPSHFLKPFVDAASNYVRKRLTTNCRTDCHTLPTKNFISHIINLGNYAVDKYNSVVAAASGPAAMKADATTFRTTVRAANSRFPILLRSPSPCLL